MIDKPDSNHLTQEDVAKLMADPGYIDNVLRQGAERARAIADPIMAEVKKVVGFII